jgi:hypothetical protein
MQSLEILRTADAMYACDVYNDYVDDFYNDYKDYVKASTSFSPCFHRMCCVNNTGVDPGSGERGDTGCWSISKTFPI